MLKNFSCLGNKLERLVFSQSGIYHVWGLYADEGGLCRLRHGAG